MSHEEAGGEKLVVIGLQDHSLVHLRDRQNQPLTNGLVIIFRVLAENLDLAAGDSLTWTDELNNRTFTLPVDAIAEVYTMRAVYLPLRGVLAVTPDRRPQNPGHCHG